MLEKTFGEKDISKEYIDREGAYGIGFDEEDRVPVAMTHLYNGEKGYFLLGGGIENNESHSECLKRESLEEAGLEVGPINFVCKGDYFSYVEEKNVYFHVIGYFYYMEIGNVVATPTEFDHSLVYLTIDEIREKLFLPHQIWAVEEAYRIHKLKATE